MTAPTKSPNAPAAHPASPGGFLRRVRDFAIVEGLGHGDPGAGRQVAAIARRRSCRARCDGSQVSHPGGDELFRRAGGHRNHRSRPVRTTRRGSREIIEPFLIQRGFVQRTPRGRILTPHAFRHLGMPEPRRPDDPRDDPAGNRACSIPGQTLPTPESRQAGRNRVHDPGRLPRARHDWTFVAHAANACRTCFARRCRKPDSRLFCAVQQTTFSLLQCPPWAFPPLDLGRLRAGPFF